MRKSIHIGFAIPTLMMIFTVLSLSIFALLTYVSANANYQNAVQYAQSVSDYYDAKDKALAIYNNLKTNELEQLSKSGYNIQVSESGITYEVPYSEYAYLLVTLDDAYELISIQQMNRYQGNYGNSGFVY